MDKQKIERGIAAYKHEQRVLLRLLRKRGYFTEHEFDGWFRGREWRRPMKFGPPLTGDTFILGAGQNGGSKWAVMLDAKTISGSVIYTKGPNRDRKKPRGPSQTTGRTGYNKGNNDLKNLALLTRGEHASIHAKENVANRKRKQNGQFE